MGYYQILKNADARLYLVQRCNGTTAELGYLEVL